MSQKFTGTFTTEMKKQGMIGWVLFKTDVVEYASQEAMDAVRTDTEQVWAHKYGFQTIATDTEVTAAVSPVTRIKAVFAAS